MFEWLFPLYNECINLYQNPYFLLFFRRQLTFNHRQSLVEQLDRETEPAMALHLVAVILFQHNTSCVIHAPGRCVPQIIAFLKDHVNPDVYDKLFHYQTLVVKQLTGKSTNEDADDGEISIGAQLSENLNEIKALAMKTKKSVSDWTIRWIIPIVH